MLHGFLHYDLTSISFKIPNVMHYDNLRTRCHKRKHATRSWAPRGLSLDKHFSYCLTRTVKHHWNKSVLRKRTLSLNLFIWRKRQIIIIKKIRKIWKAASIELIQFRKSYFISSQLIKGRGNGPHVWLEWCISHTWISLIIPPSYSYHRRPFCSKFGFSWNQKCVFNLISWEIARPRRSLSILTKL